MEKIGIIGINIGILEKIGGKMDHNWLNSSSMILILFQGSVRNMKVLVGLAIDHLTWPMDLNQ